MVIGTAIPLKQHKAVPSTRQDLTPYTGIQQGRGTKVLLCTGGCSSFHGTSWAGKSRHWETEHTRAHSPCLRSSEGCKSATKYKTDTTLSASFPKHPGDCPTTSPFPLSHTLPSAPSPQGTTSNSLALDQVAHKGV